MFRYSLFLILILLVASCGPQNEKPLLSGVVWGGEGNRMIIKSASQPLTFADTILINHQGGFSWNPDTIAPGFYRFEKSNGQGVTLVLTPRSAVFIDALYTIFPNNAKISGSDFSTGFTELDNNSRLWHDDIHAFINASRDSAWFPAPEAMQKIEKGIDSIKSIYKEKALKIAEKPVLRMYALMQQAGNHQLFNLWEDWKHFSETDSLLKNVEQIKEIEHFKEKVAQYRQIHNKDNSLIFGTPFPAVPIQLSTGGLDTVAFNNNKIIYLEISNEFNFRVSATNENSIRQIITRSRGLIEFHLILINQNEKRSAVVPDNSNFPLIHRDFRTSALWIEELLGIKQFPANFFLDKNGTIVAKNVWDPQRESILTTLLSESSITP